MGPIIVHHLFYSGKLCASLMCTAKLQNAFFFFPLNSRSSHKETGTNTKSHELCEGRFQHFHSGPHHCPEQVQMFHDISTPLYNNVMDANSGNGDGKVDSPARVQPGPDTSGPTPTPLAPNSMESLISNRDLPSHANWGRGKRNRVEYRHTHTHTAWGDGGRLKKGPVRAREGGSEGYLQGNRADSLLKNRIHECTRPGFSTLMPID